ncbi:GGDEF domain-containing protein [Deinococcus hopiensis]|uniref:GGDEF domain-containing protein n=1 Tax=Deinococcus hopiensis TaxID=309885 RepID=UPI00148267B3|nr:diguanylate cyclase [Deinococcus hopiensis]
MSASDTPTILREAYYAQQHAQQAGHREHLVHAHSLMGIAHLLEGNYSHALVHQEEVLKYLNQVLSPSLKTVLLCDVGANFNDFGTPHEAMTFLEQALAITVEHDLHFARILVRENLGQTLLQLGRLEEGERLLREGLDEAVAGRYDRWEAYFRCTLGEHLVTVGDVQTGYEQLIRATEAARRVHDHYLASTSASTLGRVLRRLGRLDEASYHLEVGLKIAQSSNLLGPCKLAHQELSEALAQQGHFEAALGHFQQFHELAMKVQLEESRRHAQLLIVQQELDREREQSRFQRQANDELRLAHTVVQQQAEELARIASEDGLTGLANRRHFMTRLRERLSGPAFAIAFIDVDHFKDVNDRFGHPVGDQVLIHLGQIMRRYTRPEDMVARIGGEEFAVLLTIPDASRAWEVAERIREAVAAYAWSQIVAGLNLTVSLGFVMSPEAQDQDRLLKLADTRLYEAKLSGRNTVV